MAKIVNMGKVTRQGDRLAGLGDTIQAGQRNRETRRSNEANEKIRESALSSELASQELRKREQDLKNVKDAHDRFSSWWNNMDGQEKAIAKTSDQYKEMQKFFKSFKSLVPGLTEDNGDIVPATQKSMYKNKLEEQLAKSKLALANGTATESDLKMIQVGDKGLDKMSEAFDSAAARLKEENQSVDKRGLIQKVTEFFTGRDPQQEAQQTEALAQPQVTQPVAPVAPTNPNTNALADPLGAFANR